MDPILAANACHIAPDRDRLQALEAHLSEARAQLQSHTQEAAMVNSPLTVPYETQTPLIPMLSAFSVQLAHAMWSTCSSTRDSVSKADFMLETPPMLDYILRLRVCL